jgi:hypothetical protein
MSAATEDEISIHESDFKQQSHLGGLDAHFSSDELRLIEPDSWLSSLFGVLFIMSKETELPVSLMYAGVVIDFLQVHTHLHQTCLVG